MKLDANKILILLLVLVGAIMVFNYVSEMQEEQARRNQLAAINELTVQQAYQVQENKGSIFQQAADWYTGTWGKIFSWFK